MPRAAFLAGLAALLALAHGKAFPTDLEGNFTLTDSKKRDLCPTKIEQTSFQGVPGKPTQFVLPHNTIIQNGKRCDSVQNERKTMFYEGSPTRADYPAGLKEVLTTAGQNIDVEFKLNQTDVLQDETYYVGYEEIGRFCKGTRFLNGSTVFLFRPFNDLEMPMKGFKTLNFGVGKKHLIIIPRFEDAVCVYEAPIPAAPNATVTPPPTKNGTTPPVIPPVTAPAPGEPTAPEPPAQEDPAAEPAVSPEESTPPSGGDGGSVCFPGRATVSLADGSTKPMSSLEIGDVVQTGPASFSRVFMFTHRLPAGSFAFVRLTTAGGRSIELTPGHYLYVNGRLATAGSVRAGDALDGDAVARVEKISAEGLYNPQTEDGDIVVNGVRASAYTKTVAPGAAHAMLAPLRAAFEFVGVSTRAIEEGADGLAKVCPSGAVAY